MPDSKLVGSLLQIQPPVLTAYLETNPADSRNLRHPPGYLIWLKSQAKNLEQSVPQMERRPFSAQVQRVQEFLNGNPPQTRSVLILAGVKSWQVVPLRVDTDNEILWGLPSLTQLLWLMEEHRACAVVLVDCTGARIFHYWMGDIAEEHGERLKIDTSEWRRKDLTPPSQPGMEMLRGSHRDSFERRMEAQQVRFFAREADHIRRWADSKNLNPIFVAGPPKLVELVWAELPKALTERTVLLAEDLEHLPQADFFSRIDAAVTDWERKRERSVVDLLFDGSHRLPPVLGDEDTLAALQEGLLRNVVALRELLAFVSQCTNCGWVDLRPDSTCPACGGMRIRAELRVVLRQLSKRYKAPLQVVSKDVGGRLLQVGGIGGWLK